MQPIYNHSQFGRAMLVLLIVPVVGFTIAVILSSDIVPVLPLLAILTFMALTAVAFSSLTVMVDAERVRLHFGLNLFGRSILLDTITGVQVVRNPVWMGLGIHFIRGGMIYNVSGLDGVEITLKNGGRVRIGSDEPAALAQAIEAARQNRQPQ